MFRQICYLIFIILLFIWHKSVSFISQSKLIHKKKLPIKIIIVFFFYFLILVSMFFIIKMKRSHFLVCLMSTVMPVKSLSLVPCICSGCNITVLERDLKKPIIVLWLHTTIVWVCFINLMILVFLYSFYVTIKFYAGNYLKAQTKAMAIK